MLCFLLMINHIICLCSSFEEWYIFTLHHTGFTFKNLWYFEKLIFGSPASVLFSKSDILSWWFVTAIFAAEMFCILVWVNFISRQVSSQFAKKNCHLWLFLKEFPSTITGMDTFFLETQWMPCVVNHLYIDRVCLLELYTCFLYYIKIHACDKRFCEWNKYI